MKISTVPASIVLAINAMLAPYEISWEQLISSLEIQDDSEKKYLTIKEIEERYSIGRFTLYRKIKSGEIRAVKLSSSRSGKVLIEFQPFKRWLGSHVI